jgi:GntR family transcriptional regulator
MKIYEQVRLHIEKFITDQAFAAGSKLPSETEFSRMLNVSRGSVRSALRALEQEGKIMRTPGRGTIVKEPHLEQLLGRLTGFTEQMKLRGMTPSSRLMSAIRTPPSAPVKALLRLDKENVWKLLRVRYADNEPIAIEICYISANLLNDEEIQQLEQGSLYAILGSRGKAPVTSEESIEATLSTPDDSKLLHIASGQPVLQFERLSFDAKGNPLEFVVSTYRSDKYRVYVLLRR